MITINTVADTEKLLEQRELEAIRANARLASFQDDAERLEMLRLLCETQLKVLEESYLYYNDDEPDVERAIEQAHRLEAIERDYDRLMRQWENQLKRIEWERRQVNK